LGLMGQIMRTVFNISLALSLLLTLGFTVSGCEEPPAEPLNPADSIRTTADLLPRSPDLSPYPEPEPGDTLGAAVLERAGRHARNMEVMRDFERGTLGRGEIQDHFLITEPGRCYQVFAAGGSGISDLDLMLLSDEMVLMQQDMSPDAYPMLGLSTPICGRQALRYRIRVRAFRGAGDYALLFVQSAPHLF